jgi:hypothetical protein
MREGKSQFCTEANEGNKEEWKRRPAACCWGENLATKKHKRHKKRKGKERERERERENAFNHELHESPRMGEGSGSGVPPLFLVKSPLFRIPSIPIPIAALTAPSPSSP